MMKDSLCVLNPSFPYIKPPRPFPLQSTASGRLSSRTHAPVSKTETTRLAVCPWVITRGFLVNQTNQAHSLASSTNWIRPRNAHLQVAACAERMEGGLMLVGATAVEDKLQVRS
jgi:hypothetical protein